ncbi:helix-turn-helix domain-containing protein [Paenibacillus paeoniae]|uniref:Helix-turn-helix domain-containing protein n=1 Tax=Paenibacillus paeoniae TaxID=2292705 RepID=A0A371PK17_9BACL|nr:helix-turn-helix domain-containing protein [Paenibacillus paeoniae]REK76536.1 helix-turn-helix domain-containing protein [Paenibacillus paeoniae]
MEPWQYIVLVGAVVVVGALIMPRKKPDGNEAPQSVRNMETALDQFMENMEKDNEHLVQLIADSQQAAKQEANSKDMRIATLEERCGQLEKLLQETLVKPAEARIQAAEQPVAAGMAGQAASVPANHPDRYEGVKIAIEDQNPKSNSIHDRYSELFRLYAEGKSIEAIAKRLGMNKGEVQLIIGLSKQEGSLHV